MTCTFTYVVIATILGLERRQGSMMIQENKAEIPTHIEYMLNIQKNQDTVCSPV